MLKCIFRWLLGLVAVALIVAGVFIFQVFASYEAENIMQEITQALYYILSAMPVCVGLIMLTILAIARKDEKKCADVVELPIKTMEQLKDEYVEKKGE